MYIEALQWDDINIEHIAKHCVTPAEVSDVCYGTHIAVKDKDNNNRYILSGQDSTGRYLNVVLEKLPKAEYRPITAFEMSEQCKRIYIKKDWGRDEKR